jgi:hypothetical protein
MCASSIFGKCQLGVVAFIATSQLLKRSQFMKNFLQIVLVVSLVILLALVLIPGCILFVEAGSNSGDTLPQKPTEPSGAPSPPVLLSLDLTKDIQSQLNARKQQLDLYSQDVQAYDQEVKLFSYKVDAYKTAVGSFRQSRLSSAYELVAKNTLATILSSLIVGLLTFVFATSATHVLDNLIKARHGRPVRDGAQFIAGERTSI